MDKEKNFEKGSTEYYKDLCFKADINLRYETWDFFEGDNIPEFVELIENSFGEKIDYTSIFEYWGEKMCW